MGDHGSCNSSLCVHNKVLKMPKTTKEAYNLFAASTSYSIKLDFFLIVYHSVSRSATWNKMTRALLFCWKCLHSKKAPIKQSKPTWQCRDWAYMYVAYTVFRKKEATVF